MLERIVERLVAWAIAHAKLVIALGLVLTIAAAFYTAHTLKMDTDTARMISTDLPWKQEQARINAAFPQNIGLLVVMIDGQVVQAGTPVELFERPRHTFVGHFIGSPGMNVLPCAVDAALDATGTAWPS